MRHSSPNRPSSHLRYFWFFSYVIFWRASQKSFRYFDQFFGVIIIQNNSIKWKWHLDVIDLDRIWTVNSMWEFIRRSNLKSLLKKQRLLRMIVSNYLYTNSMSFFSTNSFLLTIITRTWIRPDSVRQDFYSIDELPVQIILKKESITIVPILFSNWPYGRCAWTLTESFRTQGMELFP